MRDYGKISPRFWIGRTGRQLRGDPEAQLVAAYLMTAPGSNMIGVFYAPIVTISNDTGLSMEGASKGLRRLIEGGFCLYDDELEWVWVREMARFQIEDTLSPKDKRAIGIAREFEKLPESPLKQGFHARYRHAFHLPEWPPAPPGEASPMEGASEPHRSQEQEQEQEKTLGASAPSEPAPPDPFEEFWEIYPERKGPNPKKPAKAKFEKLCADGEDPARIIAAARRLARTHPRPTPYIPQAVTWLNQERFADDDDAKLAASPVTDERWLKRLTLSRQTREWSHRDWGPMPGVPGCKVPSHLLAAGDGVGWVLAREAA